MSPSVTKMLDTCGKQKKVMIVDDDFCVREALSYALESEGCRVYTATDGLEALEFLDRTLPDIVLLDGRMPRMNGWELKQKMDADARFDGVLVFGMSTEGQNAPLMKADVFFPKPFQLDSFIATLRPYLHSH